MFLKQFAQALDSKDKWLNVFIIILIAILTGLNALKAILIPFGFDESATFFHYISFWRVLPFVSDWDANNHYLNSLLTLIFSGLFGESNLALRLANVLAFPVYLWFIFLISLKINNLIARLSFVFGLFFSLHFIDFFCLSRGYGLSLGLISVSVYFLSKAWELPSLKNDFKALIFAALATYANLTLINTFLIVIALVLVRPLFRPNTVSRKALIIRILTYFAAGIVPLIFITFLLLVLKSKGALYYGLPAGFVETSIGSLLYMLTGFESGFVNWLFLGVSTAILCSTAYILLHGNFKNNVSTHYLPLLFNALFLLNLLAPLVLKYLLNVNYPQDRTILYLWLFFVASLVFTIDWFIQAHKPTAKWLMILLLPFLYFPIHFAVNLNFTHTFHYADDSLPPRFFEKIKASHIPGEYPPIVGGYQTRLLTWNMYNYRSGGNECQISYKNYPGLEEDFQIVDPKIFPTWKTYYDSIDYDNIGKRVLYKRKQRPETTLLATSNAIDYYGNPAKEFVGLFETKVDTLVGSRLRLEIDMSIYVHQRKTRAWIVVTTQDQQNKELIYQFLPLHWFKQYWDGSPHNFKTCLIIPELPAQSHHTKVFLWNLDKQPLILKDGKIFLYKYAKRETVTAP